jgi:hypothetical protein
VHVGDRPGVQWGTTSCSPHDSEYRNSVADDLGMRHSHCAPRTSPPTARGHAPLPCAARHAARAAALAHAQFARHAVHGPDVGPR